MWKLKLSEADDEWIKSANNHVGRQFWEFDPNLGRMEERAKVDKARQEFHENRHNVKHSSDLLMRLQSEDGFWPGDYAGPLFLIPGLEEVRTINEENGNRVNVNNTFKRSEKISMENSKQEMEAINVSVEEENPEQVIGLSVMGNLNKVLSEEHQREIRRYLYNHQNIDGGWGLHIEGCSTMLCTGLNYVALRLLGERIDSGDGAMEKARKWILDHGGVTHIPSWGKMWLS
ncbi:hypothetical protein RJ640_029450, partial [Escallonia rubra]